MTTKKHVYYVLLAGLSFCTVNYVVTAVRPVVVPPQITQKPAPLFSDSNALKLYTAMQTGTTPTISIMPPVTSINALSTVGKTLLDYAASAPYWASTWMTLIGQAGGLTSSLLTTAQQLFPDPTAQICYGMMNLSYVAPQTSLLPTTHINDLSAAGFRLLDYANQLPISYPYQKAWVTNITNAGGKTSMSLMGIDLPHPAPVTTVPVPKTTTPTVTPPINTNPNNVTPTIKYGLNLITAPIQGAPVNYAGTMVDTIMTNSTTGVFYGMYQGRPISSSINPQDILFKDQYGNTYVGANVPIIQSCAVQAPVMAGTKSIAPGLFVLSIPVQNGSAVYGNKLIDTITISPTGTITLLYQGNNVTPPANAPTPIPTTDFNLVSSSITTGISISQFISNQKLVYDNNNNAYFPFTAANDSTLQCVVVNGRNMGIQTVTSSLMSHSKP